MAGDDDQDPQRGGDDPSAGAGPDPELPSLFRRRSRKKREEREEPSPAVPGVATDAPAPETEELPVTARPVGTPPPEQTPTDVPTQPLRPVPGATRRPPTAPPPPPAPAGTLEPQPAAQPQPEPDTEPRTEPETEPEQQPRPAAGTPPARPPRPTGPPPTPRRRGPEMTWSGDRSRAGSAVEEVAARPGPGRVAVADAPAHAEQEATDDDTASEAPSSGRRRPSLPSVRLRLPALSPRLAAVVTGVAVAVTGIVLVWLSLAACTSVRGVSTCGGIGLLGIALTLVAQAAVGTIVLGALGVAQARSTSVLGVGVTSFVAMVLLYASLPGLWLGVALLVVTPAAFWLAEGVTSGRFSDSS